MLTVTSAQLDAWLAGLLWPLTRVLAVLAAAPVLGQTRIHSRVRIGLAIGIVLVIAPSLPPLPQVAPGSAMGMLILAYQLVIGLAIIGHAANLLIFTVGGLTRGQAPIIPTGEATPPPPFADPLPQALILTAIVIGFGVQAFTVVLLKRIHQSIGADEIDQLRSTEQ